MASRRSSSEGDDDLDSNGTRRNRMSSSRVEHLTSALQVRFLIHIINACKRSQRKVMFQSCVSVYRGRSPWDHYPPTHPPPQNVQTCSLWSGYGTVGELAVDTLLECFFYLKGLTTQNAMLCHNNGLSIVRVMMIKWSFQLVFIYTNYLSYPDLPSSEK